MLNAFANGSNACSEKLCSPELKIYIRFCWERVTGIFASPLLEGKLGTWPLSWMDFNYALQLNHSEFGKGAGFGWATKKDPIRILGIWGELFLRPFLRFMDRLKWKARDSYQFYGVDPDFCKPYGFEIKPHFLGMVFSTVDLNAGYVRLKKVRLPFSLRSGIFLGNFRTSYLVRRKSIWIQEKDNLNQ